MKNKKETKDQYYERMISELPMFGNKKVVSKPEPKQEVKPEPKVVVKEEKKAQPKPKIIRIPFTTRIVRADPVMKAHYNELKSFIMSYGVKSRVSNSGDTFRLHTVTYVKLGIAGNSLKLHFALNPKDYKDTTLPFIDAGSINIYKEIPLVFKVKSNLSMRRAKELVVDVMAKGNLKQRKIVERDWVKEIEKGNF